MSRFKALIAGWALDFLIEQIVARIRRTPLALRLVEDYSAGANVVNLMRDVTGGIKAPGVATADEILNSVAYRPLKDVAAELLREIKMPDLDDDPANDAPVLGLIDRIVREALKQ